MVQFCTCISVTPCIYIKGPNNTKNTQSEKVCIEDLTTVQFIHILNIYLNLFQKLRSACKEQCIPSAGYMPP